MTDQLLFPITKRHQRADRLSLPTDRPGQNHCNHGNDYHHNNRRIQCKLRNQIIRLVVDQTDSGIGFLFHIFLRSVILIKLHPEGTLLFRISVADRIKLHRCAKFCHRLLRDDSDSKSGLIRYSLRKVIKHNGIIRFHAKSADRKLSSGKFEFITYRNAIGFGIVVGEHQFIPGLDIASFRYGIKIHVLRLCMQPELRIMVFQIHILLLFQRFS